MTTQAIYRCTHCLVEYTYYPSGCPYTKNRLNDDTYCPDCKQVILDVLKNVPPRVERFTKPYDGITLEALKERVEKERNEKLFRRVASPLFDMNDPSNDNIAGWIKIDELDIFYSYWTKRNDYRIEVEMERNLVTGKEYPWREIRNRYP